MDADPVDTSPDQLSVGDRIIPASPCPETAELSAGDLVMDVQLCFICGGVAGGDLTMCDGPSPVTTDE